MQRVTLEAIEKYDAMKFYRTEVFKGERSRTLLLTLVPGQSVPSHKHEGYDVLLEPLRGEALIMLDGETFTLRAEKSCSRMGRMILRPSIAAMKTLRCS